MKILVTGGTGYIGSHIVVELLSHGHHVEILDNLSRSNSAVIDHIQELTGKSPVLHHFDLCDAKKTEHLLQTTPFDLIIHLAGFKSVKESLEKPLLYYDNNLTSTLNLLTSAHRHNIRNFIFSSSATVYGEQKSSVCTEELETGHGITSPYGRTKFMIEEILKDLASAWPDFCVASLRYFNPIGNHPSGLLGENPLNASDNLMPYLIEVALGKRDHLSIFGHDYDTRDGTCERDFIHVVDLACGHLAAIDALKSGFTAYNLGTGHPTSVLELVHTFEKVSGKPLPYQFAPRRAGDLARFWANPEKAEHELHWHTKLTIKDAMKDTLTFLKTLS